jgi:hypothetical protein
MKTLSVILTTGTYMGDSVLRGVYGTSEPSAVEGGVAKFTVSPEFSRVSHLFSYLESGSAPIAPTAMVTLQVEEDFESTAKAQLMHALALRWNEMYAQVTPQQPGPLAAMLKGEAAQVANGAKSHLISMGMRAFMVPLTCTMVSSSLGRYIKDERALVEDLQRSRPQNIAFLADEAPTDLGTSALGGRVVVQARDHAPEPAAEQPVASFEGGVLRVNEVAATDAPPVEPVVAPPWSAFDGIEATVKGTIVVVAPSMDMAVKAAKFRMELSQAGQIPMPNEIAVESILAVANRQLGEYDADFDDGDEYTGDADRDRG